jgi:porin
MVEVSPFRQRTRPTTLVLSTVLLAAIASPVLASPPPLSVPISSDQNADGTRVSGDFLGSLQRSNFLLGDMFGLRSALSPYGITIAIQETSEILGNVSGGYQKGAAYDGLTQAVLQLDTQRAFGWHGGLFNISALQIHGRNLSADNLGSLQTASGIEADRATRLWELWYQQKLLADDRLDIKVGLQSADQEFIVNPNGAYFINTMFGWPVVPSYDLPGGGPAYPLSAPAIRFRYRPINPLAVLLAVYSGSPASNNNGDSQQVNASGTQFPVNRGPLVFAELQYSYPSLGGMMNPDEGEPLGHTYKIGAWYDGEHFDDLRLDNTGQSLASPTSSGVPQRHYGNYSFYAAADQMVWRDSSNPNRSVSVFGRGMGTPQGNRNLVDYSFNGGVVYHDPFTNRADDTVGLGFGYAHVSHAAAAYDRDAAAYNLTVSPANYMPIRSSETFIEATYQYQVTAWWQLQPDAQYVFKPGGSVQNQVAPSQRVRNEFIAGLRTNILF